MVGARWGPDPSYVRIRRVRVVGADENTRHISVDRETKNAPLRGLISDTSQESHGLGKSRESMLTDSERDLGNSEK